MKTITRFLLSGVGIMACIASMGQQIHEPAGDPVWSQPYPPFRIVGNLYYVGTYDLACYLIVTQRGNILINTGLAASEPMIKESIEALGFEPDDTKILLTTQAHHDHVAAMAKIRKQTGAKMVVDEGDAPALLDGGNSDYAFGGNGSTYAPVTPDRLLHDGDTISLGDMNITMLHHPGHTKGSCSFLFDVNDGQKIYRVLIANLPSIVTSKKFSEITVYPGIAKDYAYTLQAMKKLSFDIWLSSHAGQFALHTKHKPGDAYNPEVFNDRKGYDQALRELENSYREKMAKE